MRRGRRSGLVLAAASALCLVPAFAGAAMASPLGVVKGAPQPELKPFKLGNLNANSPGTIAMEPDGSLVAVYDIQSGAGKTVVCVLDRGKSACADKPLLTPLDGDSTFNTPEVFIPSANHVYVLQSTCCDSNTNGDNLLYASTDGGKTFGAPVRVGGGVGVDAAALAGNDIVFTEGDSGALNIQSVSLTSPGPPPSTATPVTGDVFGVGVADYRGGALVGGDFSGASFDTAKVVYAPADSDFNATGSYRTVGKFPKETFLAMSGDALLTVQTQGKEDMLLRLFNGRGFGASHVMPGGAGCTIGCSIAIDQDPSGAVHVFIERSAFDYDLVERTTTDGGSKWGGAVNLGNAISDGGFAAALDSRGTGLVLGTDVPLAYPVLADQGVSLSLSRSSIRKGQTVSASGRVTPHDSGRSVQLQVEVGKNTWRNVTGAKATTKSGGSFSIKIKGKSAGTFTYRAVASDLAGYLQFGYSGGRTLKVTS
jgi:hypothetical protein